MHGGAHVEINDAEVVGELALQEHLAAPDARVERRGGQHAVAFDCALVQVLHPFGGAQVHLNRLHGRARLGKLSGYVSDGIVFGGHDE